MTIVHQSMTYEQSWAALVLILLAYVIIKALLRRVLRSGAGMTRTPGQVSPCSVSVDVMPDPDRETGQPFGAP